MSDDFETKRRMSEDHFRAAVGSGKPDETTPPAITTAVKEFAANLGQEPPQYVPVVKDTLGLYAWCSDGVLEKMKTSGGTIRFGWTIWEWPDVLLTGEFHAVWISPTEELIDITPKPHGEDRIVFVPDASFPADFDFDKRPRNKRHRLYLPNDPAAEIAANIARMTPGQLAYERQRAAKAGVLLEQSLRNKRTPDPMVKIVDDFIRVSDEYDKELDATPGEGYVQATPKLRSLRAEKLWLQTLLTQRR
jgi:hypothetical protein